MENDPQGADFEQASARLSDGLRSCRAVVEDYRSKLASGHPGSPAANQNQHSASNDTATPGDGVIGSEGQVTA